MIYSNEYILVADDALLETNFFEEIDRWKTSNQNHAIQKFKSTQLSDDDYERVKLCIETMKDSMVEYPEYKKAFDRFCYFCHIVPRGVIIRSFDLKYGKPNHHSLYVEYTYNTKKMELPEGTTLYHMSKVGGITELLPFFQGKAAKGYLYDKPRIYFTIRKNMPKFLADYKFNEKLHMYVCKEKIKYVYVDPLVWSNIQGAVYVETNKPIKVEEVTKSSINRIMNMITGGKKDDSKEEPVEESAFDIDHFMGFVTENGLIPEED